LGHSSGDYLAGYDATEGLGIYLVREKKMTGQGKEAENHRDHTTSFPCSKAKKT